jgi:imidazolonepropionase-like amidohydrolase
MQFVAEHPYEPAAGFHGRKFVFAQRVFDRRNANHERTDQGEHEQAANYDEQDSGELPHPRILIVVTCRPPAIAELIFQGAGDKLLATPATRGKIISRFAGISVVASVFFAWVQGGAQAAATRPENVQRFISVDAPVVALRHVRVFDGTGGPVAEDQTVILADGKIKSMGATRAISIPKQARILDLAGRTLIPGLVMMHEHLVYPTDRTPEAERMYTAHPVSFPRLYLAAGVTTMRTAGTSEPVTDLGVRRDIEAGLSVGPDIDVTGDWMNGPGQGILQIAEIADPESARRAVEYWSAEGVTSFKAYMFLKTAPLAALIETAHRHGLKVAGHLCAVTAREAAGLGIDSLEHGLLVFTDFVPGKKRDECPSDEAQEKTLRDLDVNAPQVLDLIRELVAKHVAVTSTLAIFEPDAKLRPPLSQRALDTLTQDAQISYLRRRARIADDPDDTGTILLRKEMQFERLFAQMGGLLTTGTDPTGYGGVIAGFGNWRELRLLAEAGFSPVEVIKLATLNGARYLGRDSTIGSIAVGKQADLVVIHGNPAAAMTDIDDVEIVFRKGVGYDPVKLIQSAKGLVGSR